MNCNEIVEELKQSFLVQELGYSLDLAAETYDEMDDRNYYQQALNEVHKMAQNTVWFGYNRSEYYDLIWQPGDPEWEDLKEAAE